MSLYNLETSASKISMQPFLHYKRKGLKLFLPAILFLIAPQFFNWRPDINIGCYIVAGMWGMWSLYDYIIVSKTIIVFDKNKSAVFKQIPGIICKRLIAFSEIESIIPIYTNGVPQYCITHNKNMFGKNFPITDHFYGNSKEQQEFEDGILPLIYNFINK